MRLNSARSLEIGRTVLRENGGSWATVYSNGKRRSDGVVAVKSKTLKPSTPPADK